jgi:type II secretory pathway pseudopilin PulG
MTAAPPWAWSIAAGGPLIGRKEGQRLARQELARVGFWQRVLNWIGRLLHGAGNVVPRGWFGLVVLAVLVIVVALVVVFWVSPRRARRSTARSVLTGQDRTAQDYRRAAQQHADAGDYAAAILDGVRAIAAELDERKILPPRPGRTADELALEAGRELPALAADLRAVTSLFDDVLYGDRDGTPAGYQLVSRLDEGVRVAKATPASAPALAGLAVPR